MTYTINYYMYKPNPSFPSLQFPDDPQSPNGGAQRTCPSPQGTYYHTL